MPDTGSMCTGSVGVMPIVSTQATGLESVAMESVGMGYMNATCLLLTGVRAVGVQMSFVI